MALLPSESELGTMHSVEDARVWAGLAANVWEAVNTVLGSTDSLRVLATMPVSIVQTAIQATRVLLPLAEPVIGGMV